MTKQMHLVGIAVVAMLTAPGSECGAVDASRAKTQSRTAPAWANPATNNYVDPSFGAAPSGPVFRDRNTVTAPPLTGVPSISADPLRIIQPFSDSLESTVVQPTPTLQKWRLGVFPENTDTGVLISEVVRDSAAERAGLEVNDRLVSVAGYQIGYVDGTLHDVGQEFERHADPEGWVRVLVQNNRDGQLMNLPIQLDRRHETISGTVTYRDRSALPPGAVLTVELRELVRSDLRPITLAEQTFPAARQPIQFNLEYDPTQVDARRRYELNASIAANGRQLYALRQGVPILGGGATQGVQLVVDSVTTCPGGSPTQNRNQQLEQIASWFREYLGREPRPQELYVWEAHLARGGSLADAQLQILSTPEFYYQSNANDEEYVRRMFQLVANRQPSQQEINQWVSRLQYHNRLRSELAREFLTMANAQAGGVRRR